MDVAAICIVEVLFSEMLAVDVLVVINDEISGFILKPNQTPSNLFCIL